MLEQIASAREREEQMSTKSEFAAAEEIKGILVGRDKSEQEQILRWVAESLGLVSAAAAPTVTRAPQVAPPIGDAPVPPTQSRPAIDLRSFVVEKQPKSDMQFAATVAYYFHFVAPERDRKEAITKDDLQTAARLANRRRYQRPDVPLNNAVTNGYLDRAGRGEYRLNAVGENLVAMTLPGKGGENGSKRSRKKPARKKARSKRKG